MRHLYQNGATFWVVADTWQRAVNLVASQECRDDFDEPPHLDYPLNERQASEMYLTIDSEPHRCSLWVAYLLVMQKPFLDALSGRD